MYCLLFTLLMFIGGMGALSWLAWQRVTAHMRANPEAAKLVAEHILAVLLTGEKQPKIDKLEEVPDPEP